MKVAFRYAYERPTGSGRQLFRVLPATIPGIQSVSQAQVRIAPLPLETAEFTDFFGTRVIEVIMPAGITELDFVLEAHVHRIGHGIGLDISVPRDRIGIEVAAQRSLAPSSPHHFLAPTARIPHVPEIADYARRVTAGAGTTRETVERLGLALHHDIRFDAKATDVNTPPDEAFRLRRGVCQDFAQIMVGALRSLNIPAAHVGGYLRTLPPPGKPRLVGADASHAWVRAWCGSETGWVDYDPTNACYAQGDHIDIGFGRDYDDVAPISGVMRLAGAQEGSHSVDIEEAPLQSQSTPQAWTPLRLDLGPRSRRQDSQEPARESLRET